MTNKEILVLRNVSGLVEEEYFKSESKCSIPVKVLYACQKVVRQTKDIAEESKAMYEGFMKVYKDEIKFDESKISDESYIEEMNKGYAEFLKSDESKAEVKEFEEKEYTGELHKIEQAILDESVMPNFMIIELEKLVK